LISRALVGVLLLAGCAAAGPGADAPVVRPEVPWVASEMAIVNAMLDAAGVGANDVVYDLGCGDGRIVINAAQRGARGVGVDIDPKLIRDAQRLAQRAGVGDRVTFAVQDLFETDLKPATVVALYLSPELNLRLRPKLLKDLRPGTRIVSHDFDMGDWRPERSLQVRDVARAHKVFLWTVPAR
jgi:SAM-dependent methyltransferase